MEAKIKLIQNKQGNASIVERISPVITSKSDVEDWLNDHIAGFIPVEDVEFSVDNLEYSEKDKRYRTPWIEWESDRKYRAVIELVKKETSTFEELCSWKEDDDSDSESEEMERGDTVKVTDEYQDRHGECGVIKDIDGDERDCTVYVIDFDGEVDRFYGDSLKKTLDSGPPTLPTLSGQIITESEAVRKRRESKEGNNE
jgi:hypothetical protein